MLEIDKKRFIPKSQQPRSLFCNKSKMTLFEAMVELYHATLDVKDFKEVSTTPELYEFVKGLYKHHGFSEDMVHPTVTLVKQTFPVRTDSIIHLVTAGKDSTATALKHAAGHYNYLIHVTGVNKIYPTEHKMCRELYKKYFVNRSPEMFEYHDIKAWFPRVTGASESPIKNMMITVMAIEFLQIIPKWVSLGGSQKIADVSETEVYGDTSMGLVPFFEALNASYGSTLAVTPYLRDQVEAYALCDEWGIEPHQLASCMSQLRFKPKQRSFALEKFSRTVDGATLIAGQDKETGQSIFQMTQDKLDALGLSGLKNIDRVYPDTDYRCIQGCFKCRERALVHTTHFGYEYHPDYIKKCKDGIISWMDKSPNNNRINLEPYFIEVLGIPLESIPDKYKLYMRGEATRPDGWKAPKSKPTESV